MLFLFIVLFACFPVFGVLKASSAKLQCFGRHKYHEILFIMRTLEIYPCLVDRTDSNDRLNVITDDAFGWFTMYAIV